MPEMQCNIINIGCLYKLNILIPMQLFSQKLMQMKDIASNENSNV